MKLIAEGAEAKIYETEVKGLACILKDRIKKSYRLPEIDKKLRKLRTRHEASLLSRAARAGVNVPKVIDLTASQQLEKDKEFILCIEEINGPKVRDYLLKYEGDDNKVKVISTLIGKQVAKMHSADITHGDLTTSNMIFNGEKVYLIDFGLGQVSKRLEDKAVDLHLLKECLKSKHYEVWELAWKAFKETYSSISSRSKLLSSVNSLRESACSDAVFEQLKLVEARGRYRRAISADFASAKYKKLKYLYKK